MNDTYSQIDCAKLYIWKSKGHRGNGGGGYRHRRWRRMQWRLPTADRRIRWAGLPHPIVLGNIRKMSPRLSTREAGRCRYVSCFPIFGAIVSLSITAVRIPKQVVVGGRRAVRAVPGCAVIDGVHEGLSPSLARRHRRGVVRIARIAVESAHEHEVRRVAR